MAQQIRVVGWLRFRNRSSLEKALTEFEKKAIPGALDRSSWEVDGLDAHIALDRELPGDIRAAEEGFVAAYREATRGYLDYFEQGKTDDLPAEHVRIFGHTPVWRWTRFGYAHPQLLRDRIALAGAPALAWLTGSLAFESEEEAQKALATLPGRLPFLTADGVLELRLDETAFTQEGATLTASATLQAPREAIEAVCEALGVLGAKARSGALLLLAPPTRYEVAAGAKKLGREPLPRDRQTPPDDGRPAFAPVDPATPRPARPEPRPAAPRVKTAIPSRTTGPTRRPPRGR
jgi:hypothetical protein